MARDTNRWLSKLRSLLPQASLSHGDQGLLRVAMLGMFEASRNEVLASGSEGEKKLALGECQITIA